MRHVTFFRVRRHDQQRDSESKPAVVHLWWREVIPEPTPVVPYDDDRGRIPVLTFADSVDDRRDPVGPGIDYLRSGLVEGVMVRLFAGGDHPTNPREFHGTRRVGGRTHLGSSRAGDVAKDVRVGPRYAVSGRWASERRSVFAGIRPLAAVSHRRNTVESVPHLAAVHRENWSVVSPTNAFGFEGVANRFVGHARKGTRNVVQLLLAQERSLRTARSVAAPPVLRQIVWKVD